MPITNGSVCSGIEAATVAWEPLGWQASCYAEIEPFPCAVLAHHYPATPNYEKSESFAADKRTLIQYRRYTGRAEGMSISFEAHLLGERVEFDPASATLTIKNLPIPLIDQLKRATALDS